MSRRDLECELVLDKHRNSRMHPGKHLLVALERNMASLALYDFLALTLALNLGHGIV